MADLTTAAIHGPYEDLAIEVIKLIEVIIQSQPKEVQVQLWQQYMQDMTAWRDFWAKVAVTTGIIPKS